MKKFNFDCYFHLLYNKVLIFKLLIGLIIIVAACGTALYMPARNPGTSETSYIELLNGREIYINKCGGCHSLIIPERYNANDWNIWVDKMGPKARMSDEEKHLVLKYLTKDVGPE